MHPGARVLVGWFVFLIHYTIFAIRAILVNNTRHTTAKTGVASRTRMVRRATLVGFTSKQGISSMSASQIVLIQFLVCSATASSPVCCLDFSSLPGGGAPGGLETDIICKPRYPGNMTHNYEQLTSRSLTAPFLRRPYQPPLAFHMLIPCKVPA